MQAQHFEPLGFLYTAPGNYFPGYNAEAPFEHAKPVVIARIAATNPDGYSSVITETRVPAKIFKAVISDGTGAQLKLSTGTGPEMAVLVHAMCVAFADGSARHTPALGLRHSVRVGIGAARVSLFFKNAELALEVASQIQFDMLGVTKAS